MTRDLTSSRLTLAELCRSAWKAGPDDLGTSLGGEDGLWGVPPSSPANTDLREAGAAQPLATIPVKLATAAAAMLDGLGALLAADPTPRIGYAVLGRSVLESCATAMWILDHEQSTAERIQRAWLVWAVAEGHAAETAVSDGGATGAMAGSPARLTEIKSLIAAAGLTLDASRQPNRWTINGTALPGHTALVAWAVKTWTPGANGRVLYGQLSRAAHLDVLVATAFVNDRLEWMDDGEGPLGCTRTALAVWALTWARVLRYFDLESDAFGPWLAVMLPAVGRGDLLGAAE